MVDFVERHGLWSNAQVAAAREMATVIERHHLEVVRVALTDQHGLLHAKSIIAGDALKTIRAGVHMPGTILLKDTAGKTCWPVFGQDTGLISTNNAAANNTAGLQARDFQGASDIVVVADPTTFKVLPWATNTGWVLGEAYFPDGRPVPFDSRHALRRALAALSKAGYDYVSGLEVEFHVFKIADPRLGVGDAGWPGSPPAVTHLTQGYQLLSEQRADQLEIVLESLRRDVIALGLPLRSVEAEMGPSQCEFVFDIGTGISSADTMVLFRSAVKQSLRRRGYHATFMCRPNVPHAMASGWHLHQSLRANHASGQDRNALMRDAHSPAADLTDARAYLSTVGVHYLGGLLEHAAGYAAFATPTINGYRRYHRPGALAPDRIIWGADHRGAMIRVIGAAGDPATRIENRIGEPAANPYLTMAAQIYAGLDGITKQRDPGPAATASYEGSAAKIPDTLDHAVVALRESTCMRAGFGSEFVDYFARIKDAELARFHAEVTEWEQREYFELY